MRKTKLKLKTKWKKLILNFFIVLFLCLFIFSSYKILMHKLDGDSTNKQLDDINESVKIIEVNEENVELIENNDIDKTNPYWDFIKMNLIDVNFNDLKKTNSDVVGWIQVNGTNINYPFVQTDNNDFYLNHAFNKSNNSAGWVFLDYRNNLSNYNDKNTIIYAHGRLDNTMFGSLKNILNSGWLNNTNNYVIKLSTEYENTLWQVFSVYRIPTTSDYLKVSFINDKDFSEFTNILINRSNYNFNTTVNGSDRIITLSTCYNNSDKVVLHAKLIKREVK